MKTKLDNFFFLCLLFGLSFVFTWATTVKPVYDMSNLLERNHDIHVENNKILKQLINRE